MQIKVGNMSIYADGYMPIPKENAIQFWKRKSDLDCIPPIKIDEQSLSDFGKDILANKPLMYT